VTEFAGAYLATGHSVWGILNAPGRRGNGGADPDGAAHTVDSKPFNPSRMPPFESGAFAHKRLTRSFIAISISTSRLENRSLFARDRRFESGSLQRRVNCETDFRGASHHPLAAKRP
jgi:hypothetical protein